MGMTQSCQSKSTCNQSESKGSWNMMLDELVDLDEERVKALEMLTRQKERVAKAYNKKVKSKTFNVGNLV